MTGPAPNPPQKLCGHCGEMVPVEAAWCPACGTKLDEPPVPEAAITARDALPLGEQEASGADRKTEPSSGPVSEAMQAADAEPESAAGTLPPLPKGTVVDNKYAIVRVLGQGGMGIVYLAEDAHTGVEVVLKSVRPELAHRKDVLTRTRNEGRTLARIDHPNVVHLNAIVHDASGLWLEMQYIQGDSLDKTIKRYRDQGRAMSFKSALDIFRQVLQGVAAAHREGIIHRDLKPANVLVRQKDGVAKVTDFGIAKPADQARVGQGNTKGVIGSLWYMSPEQVQGRRDLDRRVDVYALGIVLFEMLTGRVPFHAPSSYEIMRLHVEGPLPEVRPERPDVPAWIDDVLARACAKSRDDRFETCEAFLAAIDAHLAGVAPPRAANALLPEETGSTEGGRAPRSALRPTLDDAPKSRLKLFMTLALVALVVLSGGAYLAWRFVYRG